MKTTDLQVEKRTREAGRLLLYSCCRGEEKGEAGPTRIVPAYKQTTTALARPASLQPTKTLDPPHRLSNSCKTKNWSPLQNLSFGLDAPLWPPLPPPSPSKDSIDIIFLSNQYERWEGSIKENTLKGSRLGLIRTRNAPRFYIKTVSMLF